MTADAGDKVENFPKVADNAPHMAAGIWSPGQANLNEFKALQVAQSSATVPSLPQIWCTPNGKPGVYTEGWENSSMIQKIIKAGLSPDYCK